MKNWLKRIVAISATLAMAVLLFSGCTSNKSGGTATTNGTQPITVKVTSIDGSKITAKTGSLAAGNGAAPQQGGGSSSSQQQGTPPSGSGSSQPQGAPPSGSGSGSGSSQPQGTPPSGSGGGSSQPQGTPPSGSGGGSSQPQMPSGGNTFTEDGSTVTFTVSDSTKITMESAQGTEPGSLNSITVDAILEVTLDTNNAATAITVKNLQNGGGNFGNGSSSEVTNGTAATTLTADETISGTTYASSGDDENALRIDGATVTLNGVTVNKSGGTSSSTENGDFYGTNAGILALNGATVTIKNATINTSAANGNGVFSYGSGTTVKISDSTIRTTEHNSGGIQTTGGGITNASNLDVETQGASSAAIRSDRGGGTVKVTGGKYVTNGTGSPAVYSTADITVSDATLTANNSEAIVVEGKNSVTLKNCTVAGTMPNGDGSENVHCVMIYQSTSGDAETGRASFSMTGGSLVSKNGDLFYVTNTGCDITLSGVALTLANDNLLVVSGNSSSRGWGTSGANGGEATFTADAQTLKGKITVDSISSLTFTMKNGTAFTGSITDTQYFPSLVMPW